VSRLQQILPGQPPTRGLPRLLEETATGRFSVRQVFPPRRALARGKGSILSIVITLLSFGALYIFVKRNRSHSFDLRVTRQLQRMTLPGFDRLMHVVSWPGFPPQSRFLAPALSLVWLGLGFPIEALFQLLAWGAGGVSSVVKRAMQRPRPLSADVSVSPARLGDTSFPSGHVLIYSGVYGFLAFLIETLVRPPGLRRIAVSMLVGLVALVGPSRIYLGHHWFTDVLASYLLGTSYLLALTAAYRRVKTHWLNRGR
jgi:membrane-associated phospholipid phosphatase